MKILPPVRPDTRMFAALRKLIMDARTAEIYEQRERITNKALHQLNAIEKILIAAVQEPGRKGGNKTAERGPEHSLKIAAMREPRARGERKKQAASA